MRQSEHDANEALAQQFMGCTMQAYSDPSRATDPHALPDVVSARGRTKAASSMMMVQDGSTGTVFLDACLIQIRSVRSHLSLQR